MAAPASAPPAWGNTVKIVLIFLAVICFILAMFKVSVPVDLIPLGLALGFAAMLPWF